jgi:hypothetical protein
MEVPVEVSRVGAEAEVEKMTVDTPVVIEIALMKLGAEVEISTEEVAHDLGVRTDIIAPGAATAETETTQRQSQEKTVEIEMKVDEQVEAQRERAHLL